jgi:choline-phosphate cytidylyltransferase
VSSLHRLWQSRCHNFSSGQSVITICCRTPSPLTCLAYRIVRDYEKYISRQFKRGTSRQELNVSWLKKNEIELKRHVQDLRENITNNWTTTGQELSRELKQFWPTSRPQSPARFNSADNVRSPTAPGGTGNSKEFITGYALGLVGGVRSWVRCPLRVLTIVF